MYLYVLVAVLLSCSSLVAADDCFALNATFTTSPQICYPTYNISSLYAQNNTGGDLLSSFLASNHKLLNYTCAQAFSEYYCEKFYPECDAGTSTAACATTCNNVLDACAGDIDVFTNPNLPLPTQTDCDALSATQCTTTPAVNLTTFYTDCVAYNYTMLAKPTYFVCTPQYLIPAGNISYATGDKIFDSIADWTVEANENPDNWMYPCFKAYSNFYCSQAYPECPVDNAFPVLPVCASVCRQVIDQCNETIAQFFKAPWFTIPAETVCDNLPNNAGVDCFVAQNNTDVSYFFECDPPTACPTGTPTPTPEPIIYITGIVYPPGGPAKGGGIGAAVLVGILLLIGLLMLVMKKQDSR